MCITKSYQKWTDFVLINTQHCWSSHMMGAGRRKKETDANQEQPGKEQLKLRRISYNTAEGSYTVWMQAVRPGRNLLLPVKCHKVHYMMTDQKNIHKLCLHPTIEIYISIQSLLFVLTRIILRNVSCCLLLIRASMRSWMDRPSFSSPLWKLSMRAVYLYALCRVLCISRSTLWVVAGTASFNIAGTYV